MSKKLIYSKKDLDHCIEVGIQLEREKTIKLLSDGEHVWQAELKRGFFGYGYKWKQRCRCGFYGVFNDHLIDLIKKERQKDNETVVLLTGEKTYSIDKGYKILAKDPEMQRRRKFTSHQCGFDFGIDQQLATCTCGMISTNPYYIKGKD
jgi:hypothetical protein